MKQNETCYQNSQIPTGLRCTQNFYQGVSVPTFWVAGEAALWGASIDADQTDCPPVHLGLVSQAGAPPPSHARASSISPESPERLVQQGQEAGMTGSGRRLLTGVSTHPSTHSAWHSLPWFRSPPWSNVIHPKQEDAPPGMKVHWESWALIKDNQPVCTLHFCQFS